MRIYSWNVNGLRSCASKGLGAWLEGCGGEIVGLQEARCPEDAVPAELLALEGWHAHVVAAERAGYSGVGLWSRRPPDALETSLGAEFDAEGRLQLARFGRLWIANVYFPNGSGKDRSNDRVPFKLDFYRALWERLEPLRAGGEPVIVMGDFNTAPEPIDLARPKSNEKTSGFLPEEREEVRRWLASGWTDTFRRFDPGEGRYTWWSQRFGVREKNVGWRIDLALASPGALPFLRGAAIHPDVRGSDHCPISVELDPAVAGALPAAKVARPAAAAKVARPAAKRKAESPASTAGGAVRKAKAAETKVAPAAGRPTPSRKSPAQPKVASSAPSRRSPAARAKAAPIARTPPPTRRSPAAKAKAAPTARKPTVPRKR